MMMMMMMMMIVKSERVRRVCHVKGRQECIEDFVEMYLKMSPKYKNAMDSVFNTNDRG
jgi:hypothetical protein